MLSGDRLLGHYRLVRRIGSGGMGEVYLAEDTRINRQVAIKVVRTETDPYPDPVATQDTARLFQREMRAITMLDHPHILPLFDFGEEKDGNITLTYMVMPFRQDGSLADWLQKRGRSEKLAQNEVAHFVMQAADALQHAHDHQLIHQDVKPSNFLVRHRSGHVLPDLLLMDFGIAKITTATATASQSIRGTPAFMAPEQWRGQPQPATDQYALAIMAYLLLTGHTPFSGRMEQVMHEHFMVQPQPPSSLNPAISKDIDYVLLQALSKQPEERFASMTAFANAFQQALQGIETSTPTKLPPVENKNVTVVLTISQQEALNGTSRRLTLPGGQPVTIAVPANARDGQVLYLEAHNGVSTNKLAVTVAIAIIPAEERQRHSASQQNEGQRLQYQLQQAQLPSIVTTARRSVFHFRRVLTRSQMLLLIGLVVVIIVGSLSVFFLTRNSGSPNPYAPYTGTLALDDSFRGNTITWFQGTDNQAGCEFREGAYHLDMQKRILIFARTESLTSAIWPTNTNDDC